MLLAEVPILAIHTVDVVENTSVYHDEMLVHRLGLIPLLSTKVSEMSAEDEVELYLKVKCDPRQHSRAVYADEMVSTDPDVFPVCDPNRRLWLTTLGRGQEVNFRCYAKKGIAKMHSKWMAVGTVAMRYVMQVKLNHVGLAKLSVDARREWVKYQCHTRIFDFDEVSHTVSIARPEDCDGSEDCFRQDTAAGAPLASARPKKNAFGQYDFLFRIETTGALPAVRVVESAMDVMRRKLETMRACLITQRGGGGGGEGGGGVAELTRKIGIAPTAVTVPNQEAIAAAANDDEDDLGDLLAD